MGGVAVAPAGSDGDGGYLHSHHDHEYHFPPLLPLLVIVHPMIDVLNMNMMRQ
jgi:hypothetical protein